MRHHLIATTAAVLTATSALAQPPDRSRTPAVLTNPALGSQAPNGAQTPGAAKAAPAQVPTTLPPPVLPPKAAPSDMPSAPHADTVAQPPPAPPQRFDNSTLRLKRDRGVWQLWAGGLLLKDFGPSEKDAYDALQVFRDLRINARGYVGGVFEYYLTEGQSPSGLTRHRQVLTFDPDSLRVEHYSGQWVLRDARTVLYNFGNERADAQQALSVCKQYGFNQLGYVGHPTPSLKYLLRDPNPSRAPKGPEPPVPASAKLQAAEAPHPRLVLPEVGDVGDRVPLDARHLDLRRDGGEWVLYAGRTVLGHFGGSEREGRATLEALEQFRVSELCRVGSSGFSFFLSHGRAPQGTTVGLHARPLRVESLSVRQVGASWALCENERLLMSLGDKADTARAALAAIKYYRFDHVVSVGNGHLGDTHLFVKTRQ
jgi:hypothetical protein